MTEKPTPPENKIYDWWIIYNWRERSEFLFKRLVLKSWKEEYILVSEQEFEYDSKWWIIFLEKPRYFSFTRDYNEEWYFLKVNWELDLFINYNEVAYKETYRNWDILNDEHFIHDWNLTLNIVLQDELIHTKRDNREILNHKTGGTCKSKKLRIDNNIL